MSLVKKHKEDVPFSPSEILATENQSHGSRGSMVIRHAMLLMLVLDIRGSSPIIRADDRARRGYPVSIHRILAATADAAERARKRASKRFRVTFFRREGTLSCAFSKVATLHGAPDL